MTVIHDLITSVLPVKIQYPLKQGLKRYGSPFRVEPDSVKIQYPLKQGLKQRAIIIPDPKEKLSKFNIH